jgi:antitoxin (DNA-binding transcriptional repressor) of toxin-antitoxin stability system
MAEKLDEVDWRRSFGRSLSRLYGPVRVRLMSTKRVSVTEASGHLAELIEAARRGDDVLIEDDGKTQARLVAVPSRGARRILGLHKGEVQIREDFNAPLPDGFWLAGTP